MRQLLQTFSGMNRIILLAWAVLSCAFNASAQGDDCTILGVQELTGLYSQLNQSVDSINASLAQLAEVLALTDTARIEVITSTSGLVPVGLITQDSTITTNLTNGQAFAWDLITIPENHVAEVLWIGGEGGWQVNGQNVSFSHHYETNQHMVPKSLLNRKLWLSGGETIQNVTLCSMGYGCMCCNHDQHSRIVLMLYRFD
jgi:hypothetical protein